MSIPVSCGGCGKRFQAPDRGAGKKVPCPACKTIISIPAPAPRDEDDEYRLADLPAAPATPIKPKPTAASIAQARPAPISDQRVPQPAAATPEVVSPSKGGWVPPTRSSTPTWLRHLHWCLALAMI